MTQTTAFPKAPASVVQGFYHEMSMKPGRVRRSDHAGRIIDKYFDKNYAETGGKGNKSQGFSGFREFITATFSQLPDLDVFLQEITSDGEKVTVKVKLAETKQGVEINYLALYHVAQGKIRNRYAYSDGGF